ncbi:hypothetical protein HER10_EVM0011209 [Colletotrichum scovillei]|uniref:BZIP transcription factor n=1 Tax=Colletotrichum scovillei TaxID=1209932 RepID=A0A9P7QV36_9PEZI|nr:uncharacterized protein HER10_EVM0011209 [Colletotrichum scovillei]KAF4778834.1 hypothetical protein HER10_EVM0011209 [Colletotrichum scovillei]KAG7043703.1 bZIP transcription factor [Colletotrichum scovillei]KAG7045807.1 bZIP transcription factor [Colletotrichum scovillei]KAG7063151.1 bZIP transcription factor [Colletotrichum scovillei]
MDSTSPELPPYAMPVDFSSMAGTTPYDIIAAQFASRINSNENGYCTPTSLWSSPHSPTSSIDHSKAEDSHDDAHSPTSGSEESSKLQKGRRGNRYKNCSESVLSKRRAQNRANQRAYRKRKESRLEELQAQIQDMSQKNDALCCAYRLLANECYRLRASQQMPNAVAGQIPAWDLMNNTNANNGAGSLALDMSALDAYRIVPPPVSTSSPVPESYLDYPGSPDKLWSPY